MTVEAGGDNNLDNSVVPKEEDKVGYDTYKRVLDQKKSVDAKNKSMLDELTALKAEKASAEEAKLIEDGEIQKLLDVEKKRTQELQSSIDSNVAREIRRSKEEALRKELGPLRKEEYLQFANAESIVMEEDGSINLESVKAVASQFKEGYADLMQSSTIGLPNSAPKDGAKGLTRAKWLKLSSASEMAARMNDIID